MLGGYFSGRQKWVLANVVRNDDANGRNVTKTLEFVFPEFTPDQAESQRFWFGGAEWFFTTEKNADDDFLGVYLSLAQEHAGFSLKLKSYKFVLVDQEDEAYNVEKSSVPKIFTHAQGWGFHKFVKLPELKSVHRSYLRTNRLVLRLEMTKATAAYDHVVDLASIKMGSVGKFVYDGVDWMVRVAETNDVISAYVIKTTSAVGTGFAGQLKLSLINTDNAKLTVKRKLGVRTWTQTKTQHGEASLIKTSELRAQKGFVRNVSAVPPSPGGAAAATPAVAQFIVRFEMKHMVSLFDVPIANLTATLTGASLPFTFERYTWNVSCKKDANAVAVNLHLQNPVDHKTYHTSFAMTVIGAGKPDDDTNNLTKNFGTATFYKYATQMGFTAFATTEDLTRVKAVANSTMQVRVAVQQLDIATTYLDATVYKGGAAAVKLAKDEIEKFRKYYFNTRTELKTVKEQLETASHTASSLQSKQGKFQLELEPLQMALQAKTEAAETLLSDLEAERQRANSLKRELDKARESLGFMSMLWLESVKHVANQPATRSPTASPHANGPDSLPNGTSADEHSAMATLDICNTLRDIVEEIGTISSKQLRKEYKKKKGLSLREALRRQRLGTPLAFIEANLNIFSFEEPTITLKPKRQVTMNLTQEDITALARKTAPTAESLAFLKDAFDFVTKFVPQVLPLPVTSVFLTGPAGKTVSLSGLSTIDVVVIIDKLPDHGHAAWLPPILTQLQRVIKVKLPNATELGITDHCVHFAFEGASINLYPTAQWSSPSSMYDTMIKYPNGWYDASTAPQQVEFVKSQSEAVKSIIRIAQTWNLTSPQPVSAYLMELLAIYACTPKTADATFDPLAAISRLFETIEDFGNARIFWERFYKIDIVPHHVFTEQPLVLDPTNPIHNLANGVDIPAFKARAKAVMESGFSALLNDIRTPAISVSASPSPSPHPSASPSHSPMPSPKPSPSPSMLDLNY